MRTLLLLMLSGLAALSAAGAAAAEPWQAGVARINITPAEPMWMSGYASRTQPAQGTRHDLWAKAIALRDAHGRLAVLVTIDVVGIDRKLSQEVCARIERDHGIPRAAIALATSHTHTGPVIRSNLGTMYNLDERQRRQVADYAVKLADDLVAVAGSAVKSLAPANLSWGTGLATFAVNRRNNVEKNVPDQRRLGALVGPVDHDVPVLAVRNEAGELVAVVSGYACHATVLGDYLWSGDWPGAAQLEFERRHPGAMLLYWAGCGGDQNPLPRKTPELLDEYGRQFADAIDAVLAAPMNPLAPTLATAYEEIPLPFGQLPTQPELRTLAASEETTKARWASDLLAAWERDGGLPTTYPYPVQCWRLGDELTWIFLGGEVVVDYSLFVKHDLGQPATWVAAYANDVMAYIPSRRVLAEGGYEGADSRFIYGLPAVWSETAEKTLMDAVRKIAKDPSQYYPPDLGRRRNAP